ncbi:MAG: hypothetical protein ACI4M3_05700, partial [Acutalibacteraceae bacterium]
MENNTEIQTQELQDIEKYKELFEYEMTEVILNLKDEFTKVNDDCVKKYEESKLNSEDLKVEISGIKDVSVEVAPIDCSTKEVEISGIKDVSVEVAPIDCSTKEIEIS